LNQEYKNLYLKSEDDLQGEYAIYLRKSRQDIESEGKGNDITETLVRHEKILLDIAKRNNYKIGKIYKEVVSGDTIEARPEVQKLLEDVKLGKWKGVLVVEIERLARGETMDQGIVANAFKISNTKIITPMKIYDPNDEFDEEYFEFGLFMSRREYKTIKRRLERGRISSVTEGKYVGSIAPFGYDRVKLKGQKGYTLEPNSEAEVVKLIFKLYAYDGLSINEVARKLNEMRIKPRKNLEWTNNMVKRILSNNVYIGKIKWNFRKEVKVYKNGKYIRSRPVNYNYMEYVGLHPSIIDEKTWNIVKDRLSLNKAPVKDASVVKNPLIGLVYCAKCGRKLIRRPYTLYKKEPTLYCGNPKCDNIGVKLCLVEEKVIEGLRKWLENYKIDYSKYDKKISNDIIKGLEETIKLFTLKLEKEKEKLLKICNLLEEGIYSKEVFKVRSECINNNIEQLNKSIEEYKIKLEKEKNNKVSKVDMIPKIENIIDVYNLLNTAEEKNELLKTVITQVTYLKTEKGSCKGGDQANFIINIYPKVSKKLQTISS